MRREVFRPARVRDRDARSCTTCGIDLAGTVPVHDGGSHGRDFEGVPVCYRCLADDDTDVPSGPGYGPVPCHPAATPDDVLTLIDTVRDGTKPNWGDDEWRALTELRDRGYAVTYHWDAPPEHGGERIAFVHRRDEDHHE